MGKPLVYQYQAEIHLEVGPNDLELIAGVARVAKHPLAYAYRNRLLHMYGAQHVNSRIKEKNGTTII